MNQTLLDVIKKTKEVDNNDYIVISGASEPFYNKNDVQEYRFRLEKNKRIPDEAFFKALEIAKGNITKAAFLLKIDRSNFYLRMGENPEFKKRVNQIKESIVDFAEDKLINLLEISNPQAVVFTLSTLGKDRGYTKSTEITGSRENPVQINIVFGGEEKEEDNYYG